HASSVGSPASAISAKHTPFTTRPLSTSRQAIIRRAKVSQGTEVLHQLKTCLPGFLRMKLRTENVSLLNNCGEVPAIAAERGHAIRLRCAVRVREIEIGTIRDAAKQPAWRHNMDLVPADVRRLHLAWKARAHPGEKTYALELCRFLAPGKEPLQPQADAQ